MKLNKLALAVVAAVTMPVVANAGVTVTPLILGYHVSEGISKTADKQREVLKTGKNLYVNKDGKLMETKEISLALKSEAVSLGLCQEWTSEWDNESKDSLVEKYVKGIDFCIEHSYPTLAFMKENFDGVMQKHGVFAMEEVSVFNKQFIDIFSGRSTDYLIRANPSTLGSISHSCFSSPI